MSHRATFLIAAILLVTAPVWAQYKSKPQGTWGGTFQPPSLSLETAMKGLIDPAKLHMSHQFSSGYSSGGGTSAVSAMYLNTMTYQVSPKYQWIVALGYAGTRFNSSQTGENGGLPVGGIGFNWMPKNNILISASFSHNGAFNSWGSGYRSRLWEDDFPHPYPDFDR